ncbi:MAG: alpha-ketoacid dehydrogenase subunit alpha/beta [Anaerohalosphaeraceae bacterium]|jgi:2-oxoisovalerate dehydrogenase E1 component
MTYSLDDRRKKPTPKIADLIKKSILTEAVVLDWLRTIHEIRFFEDKVYDLLGQNIIKGASHLYAGQEAVATGAIAALEVGDVIGSTHRGHGHCGAMGNKYAGDEEARQMHWNRMMAELMGKETGYCNGRGGSMHIADVKNGNLGSTGIVGGNIPAAVGAALAEKHKKTGKIAVSFFGDGATNTGSFHESMNMASVLKVPLVAIIENNLYGMSVPFSGSPVEGAGCAANIVDIAERAAAYGVPAMIVDGQDVVAVFLAVKEAAEHARKTNEMVMIEAKTYRWYGHSRSDPKVYRTREEEKEWRSRDPIIVLSDKLLQEGLATHEQLQAIQDQAQATIEKATQFGMDSAWPNAADLARDVYVVETYANSVVEAEKVTAANAMKATAAYEKALETAAGRTKKEKIEIAKAQVREAFGMDVVAMKEAIVAAQAEEMRRDPNVIIEGEDVGLYGGAYGATKGLLEEFGPNRVIDTAISEAAIVGAAVGAAIRGLRPIAEVMYVDFITISMDQLMHNGAFNRYMFGGHAKVPMVVRTEGGVGRCIAAHHSKSLEPWLVNVPGLYVVMPSTPYDAKGLLKAAIRSDNPVVFIEHKATYGQMGALPMEEYIIPLGVADVKRPGKDVTIVTYSRQVMFALAAAKELAEKHGIDAEVIDLRTIKPLDIKTVAESVRKTGRLLTVAESFGMCGMGPEIVRQLIEYTYDDGRTGFDYLDAPPVNMAAADVPPPMSEPLENASIPTPDKIVARVRQMV